MTVNVAIFQVSTLSIITISTTISVPLDAMGHHGVPCAATPEVFCQSAIDSAQSDHDAVLQSILANKQAHIEKIRYLSHDKRSYADLTLREVKRNDAVCM